MTNELNVQGLPVLIKIEIFKMTAFHDILVYDSDNWSTYYFVGLTLSSGVYYSCV